MQSSPFSKVWRLQSLHAALLITIALTAVQCDYAHVPQARGDLDSITLLMDTTQIGSNQLRAAIDETFGAPIPTLPSFEPLYRIHITTPVTEKDLDLLKRRPNVIIAAAIDEPSAIGSLIRSMLSDSVESKVRAGGSYAFPIRDLWSRGQWALILSSHSNEHLSELIRESGTTLTDHLLDHELERRVEEVYGKAEQTHLSDSLMTRFGWSVRMQHDYVWTLDTTRFVQFRRILNDNDRWMWAWWQEGFTDAGLLTPEWINATRDSLMAIHMEGRRNGSHLATEYRRPVITRRLDHPDYLAFETLGTWDMRGDLMGGPFVNFVYYDPSVSTVYLIEYGQFAPNIGKRRFVRQFQAMGRTFTNAPVGTAASMPASSD